MIMRAQKVGPMCKGFEEDLVLYYYGEIGDYEKQKLQHHLGDCVGCARFIADLHRLLPQMALPEQLPQSFWDDYYQETVAKLTHLREQKFCWRNLFAPIRIWMIPAFGTAVIAALAFGLVLSKGNLSSLYNQAPERIPREIVSDTEQLEFFRSLDMLEALSALEGQESSKADSHAA
jgi:hypothetical protein